MQIAVIGHGNMGSGIAKRAVAAGYTVVVAGHNPANAQKVAAEVGARSAGIAEAVKGAELIILATPFGAAAEILAAAGDLNGRIVIDISNPVKPDFSGLSIGHTTSAAEEIAKLAKGARVIKAFNTVFAQLFAQPELKGKKVSVFIAGDDAAAKTTVREFVEKLGFEAIDAGGLGSARLLEPVAMLNITFGYGLGWGAAIAPTWLRG